MPGPRKGGDATKEQSLPHQAKWSKRPGEDHKILETTEPQGSDRDWVRVYALYDEGVNAGLTGNYRLAMDRLAKSSRLIAEGTHFSGQGLTMEAMINFELGRTAEFSNNPVMAIESYEKCLKVNPDFTDASWRLVLLLLRRGQPDAALEQAQAAANRHPHDARAQMVLALVRQRNGFTAGTNDAQEKEDRLQPLLPAETTNPVPLPGE